MREIILNVEKIAFGGAGFGHLDGKACFVPFAAPGDTVRARIMKEKRSYLEAELVEVITASPRRIQPSCPVFGQCGGCSLQHLGYPDQLAIKDDLFAEQLWRFARVEREVIEPIIGAEDQFGYRTRVQIKVRWSNNQLLMGFYRAGSHFVIPIPGSCAIAHPVVNNLIGELRELLPQSPEPDRIPQVDLAVGEDGQAIAIVHYIGGTPHKMIDFLAVHRGELPSADGIWMQQGRKTSLMPVCGIACIGYTTPADFLPGIPEINLVFSRGGFSQVNYRQNLQLIRLAYELAGLTGREKVLDLFCGNGNFSLPLSRFAREILGIDEYAPSISDARLNSKTNEVDNVSFVSADAVLEVRRLVAEEESFDVILLDPPRIGAVGLMPYIPLLKPRTVVYISCDPVTLARDLDILVKSGYYVAKSIPVDMFPQTYHIESVTLLKQS